MRRSGRRWKLRLDRRLFRICTISARPICRRFISTFARDAVYCDRSDRLRRRAARTVVDQLHRCLCAWLAPVLCFNGGRSLDRPVGEQDSVHLQLFSNAAA